jgi:hypothetical protein
MGTSKEMTLSFPRKEASCFGDALMQDNLGFVKTVCRELAFGGKHL